MSLKAESWVVSMVMMLLWGHISPQLLQKVMMLMKQDLKLMEQGLLDLNGIDKLAGLGTNGSHPNNVWRDMLAFLPKPKLPKLHLVQLPMKHTTLGKFCHSVPMLLPHTLFAAIYQHYPVMWEKIIYGSRRQCNAFWNAVSGSPQFASHPVRDRENFQDLCVPLKIHGDGTPVTGLGKGWGKLVDIFSVSSLLICGPTVLRNLMMFLIFQHLICRDQDHNTLDTAYKMFIWSFKACWLGKKPKYDWNGEEMFYPGAGDDLCGGFFFAIWALICDLEHGHTAYDLPNPTANACCPLCPVGLIVDVVYWDFRPSAKWLDHIYTVQAWLARGLYIMLAAWGLIVISVFSFWWPLLYNQLCGNLEF